MLFGLSIGIISVVALFAAAWVISGLLVNEKKQKS